MSAFSRPATTCFAVLGIPRNVVLAPIIPPVLNFGTLPAISPFTNSMFSATDFAGITASPFDTIAAIESLVPVPGPEMIPPFANF